MSADGSVIDSACFAGRPWLLLFHRGNWCPFCVAQVRELAAIYRALTDAGIGLVVISPQSETRTAALARRFDVPMSFLSDPGGRAAGALGIDAPGWPPAGLEALGYASDTVLSTAILVDADSRIVCRHETDNHRVRPEPDTFVRAARRAGIAPRA